MPVRPPTETEITAPCAAYSYAHNTLHGRFPDGETALSGDSFYAFAYANYVLKGRFPAGEAAIAKDAYVSFQYAVGVIRDRFQIGEAAIAKDQRYATQYAAWLKVQDPEGYAEFQLEHGDWVPDKVAEAALEAARLE